MSSNSVNEIIKKTIEDKITSISYGTPEQYLKFFEEITGCKTNGEEFQDYIEIKATRDLIVHNDRKINKVYLEKSKGKTRGTLDEIIPININYFDFTIATMKRISGIIKRETEKNFKEKNTT